jgi:hypothetical protein
MPIAEEPIALVPIMLALCLITAGLYSSVADYAKRSNAADLNRVALNAAEMALLPRGYVLDEAELGNASFLQVDSLEYFLRVDVSDLERNKTWSYGPVKEYEVTVQMPAIVRVNNTDYTSVLTVKAVRR